MFQGSSSLLAERMHLVAGPEGHIERAEGSEGVSGTVSQRQGPPIHFAAERLELHWLSPKFVDRIVLDGAAHLEQGDRVLGAARIEASRSAEGNTDWQVQVRGPARATGSFQESPAALTAQEFAAVIADKGGLVRGEASGLVRFQGSGTTAEAAQATFVPGQGKPATTLVAGPGRRARLARDRSRVAANHITTDPSGSSMDAEGRVEATLLPAPGAANTPDTGALFRTTEAVHFVAARMQSTSAGNRIVFTGAEIGPVRGWQGERSLSANRVEVKEKPDELHAETQVKSRFPRVREISLSQADFINIDAERLDYSSTDHRAVYTGAVKVQQAEGWLDASRVEVQFGTQGEGVRDVLAEGKVRLEYHSTSKKGKPEPVSGEADRAVYSASERTVRLFGDESPAILRRSGEQGGTTTGRVLRYRLDDGTIQVESDEIDRSRIRTTGG